LQTATGLTNLVGTNSINLTNFTVGTALALSNLVFADSNILASAAFVQSNALFYKDAYGYAQVGCNTNYLLVTGAGNGNVNGTNVWNGALSWTNINGIGAVSNSAPGIWTIYSSGIAAYQATNWPVASPWIITSGGSPAPATSFMPNPLLAGLNSVVTVLPGGTTIGVSPSATNGLATTNFVNSQIGSAEFILYGDASNTVSFFTNGLTGGRTIMQFPASTSCGFNEVQSYFNEQLSKAYAGLRIDLLPWRYHSTSQWQSTNSTYMVGCGAWSSILEFDVTTNLHTLYDVTNDAHFFPLTGASSSALIWVGTNAQQTAGNEAYTVFNTHFQDFSVVVTNSQLYCYGIALSGGNSCDLENIAVGGANFLNPLVEGFNIWVGGAYNAQPNCMIGYILGQNQIRMVNCGAYDVADGLVLSGNSIVECDNFTACEVGQDLAGDGASAYPSNSEYSVGAGVLMPKNSQLYSAVFQNTLTASTRWPFWFGGYGWAGYQRHVTIKNWTDQGSTTFAIGELSKSKYSTGGVPVSGIGDGVYATVAWTNYANGILAPNPSGTGEIAGIGFADGTMALYDALGVWLQSPTANNGSIVFSRTVQGTFSGDGTQLTVNAANVVGTTFDLTNAWQQATNSALALLSQNNGSGLTNTVFAALPSAPTFAQIGSVTNVTFMWNSNPPTSTAPTNWLQYYAAPSTLTTIQHFP
jgi:hypothetical protein